MNPTRWTVSLLLSLAATSCSTTARPVTPAPNVTERPDAERDARSDSSTETTPNGAFGGLQVARLEASDVRSSDVFGHSVATSGDLTLVGAPGRDGCVGAAQDPCERSGGAYVFARAIDGAWAQSALLTASNMGQGDEFGHAVSISDERAVVGAPRESSCARDPGATDDCSGTGAAYVFERSPDGSWREVAILKASNASDFDRFGIAVGISGEHVVVGAAAEDGCPDDPTRDDCDGAGAAYVFERDATGTWSEVALLKASNADVDDAFGSTVGISGERVVVGAYNEDSCLDAGAETNGCERAGTAYVFERAADGSWPEAAILKASNAQSFDLFGASVGISNGHIVVGAFGEDACEGALHDSNGCDDSGAAYVFERSPSGAWGEVALLKASNAESYDQLGQAVAISNDRLVVGAYDEASCAGAPHETNECPKSGAAYVFERDSRGAWEQRAMLKASNGESYDLFGWSVGISADGVVAGAYDEASCAGSPADTNDCPNSGAAYLFE